MTAGLEQAAGLHRAVALAAVWSRAVVAIFNHYRIIYIRCHFFTLVRVGDVILHASMVAISANCRDDSHVGKTIGSLWEEACD